MRTTKGDSGPKMEPPNGGWGWVVVTGAAISYMATNTQFSLFGLVFGDALEAMGHGTTGAAVVMNVMSAVNNFSGLAMGLLVKRFSYRRVAVAGGLLISFGLILSSFATSIWQLIVTFSFLTGIGLGFGTPAMFVAISSYFSTRRGQAVGLAYAGTGMGHMLMPHAVRALLESYGFRGTVLVLGGIALHSLVGAALLQPVRWHSKPAPEHKDPDWQPELKYRATNRRFSAVSVHGMADTDIEEIKKAIRNKALRRESTVQEDALTCFRRLTVLLDLDLLKDPVFLNMVVGLALYQMTLVNFSLVFPYFLRQTVGLTIAQTAMCMSVHSAADLASRILIPQLTDRLHISSRVIFFTGAVLVAIIRSILAEQTGYYPVLIVSGFAGFVRASTVFNTHLSISEYCSKEKLPTALGISLVLKGVSILAFGPLMGLVRDTTGSFPLCIHVQSLIILFTMAAWVIEFLLKRRYK